MKFRSLMSILPQELHSAVEAEAVFDVLKT